MLSISNFVCNLTKRNVVCVKTVLAACMYCVTHDSNGFIYYVTFITLVLFLEQLLIAILQRTATMAANRMICLLDKGQKHFQCIHIAKTFCIAQGEYPKQ